MTTDWVETAIVGLFSIEIKGFLYYYDFNIINLNHYVFAGLNQSVNKLKRSFIYFLFLLLQHSGVAGAKPKCETEQVCL